METVRPVLLLSGLRFARFFNMSRERFTRFFDVSRKADPRISSRKNFAWKAAFWKVLGFCASGGLGPSLGKLVPTQFYVNTAVNQSLKVVKISRETLGVVKFLAYFSFGGITVLLEYNMCLYVEIIQSKELKPQFLFSGQPLALKTLNRTERKFNRRSLCLWSSLRSFPLCLPNVWTLIFTNIMVISNFMKRLDVQTFD